MFNALGIKTDILPVFGTNGQYAESNPSLGIKGYTKEYRNDPKLSPDKRGKSHPIWSQLEGYRKGGEKIHFEFDDDGTEAAHLCVEVETRWKVLAMGRQSQMLADFAELARSEGLDTSGVSYGEQGAEIGIALRPYIAFVDMDWAMEEVSKILLFYRLHAY